MQTLVDAPEVPLRSGPASGARGISPLLGYLLIAAAAVCWGHWSLFFRQAEQAGPLAPTTEVCLVFLVMSGFTLPLVLWRGASQARPWWAWLFVVGFGITDACTALSYFSAMRVTSVGVAALSHYLAPLFVALLAPLLLGETWRARSLVAAGVGVAGLGLVLEPWRVSPGSLWWGATLGAISAVFYTGNVILAKRASTWFSPLEIFAWHLPPAVLLTAPLLGEWPWQLQPLSLVWLAAGGLIPGALAGLFFLFGLQAVDASRGSVLALLEPVVAVGLGILCYGEAAGWPTLVGAALVVLGGFWAMTGSSRTPGEVAGVR